MELKVRRQRPQGRQKRRHHKCETLRMASKGLDRIHNVVSSLEAVSEAIPNATERSGLFPLYCKQDIFIFYIQWLIFLLIGNTMKNTMLRKGLTIF